MGYARPGGNVTGSAVIAPELVGKCLELLKQAVPGASRRCPLAARRPGRTTEFYTRLLGMSLVHAMKVPPGLGTGSKNGGNPPYEESRHYFFDMGNDSLLAFFEIPRGKEPAGNRNAIGAMQ